MVLWTPTELCLVYIFSFMFCFPQKLLTALSSAAAPQTRWQFSSYPQTSAVLRSRPLNSNFSVSSGKWFCL